MDPNVIDSYAWENISVFVTNIWLFVAMIIIFAANMLIGHNTLPSLIESKHVPVSFSKLRIPFYVVAVIAFGAALFFVFSAFQGGLDAIEAIYPDYWI